MKTKISVGVAVLICIGIIAGYWFHSRSKNIVSGEVSSKPTSSASVSTTRDPAWEYKVEDKEIPEAGITALLTELKQEGWTVQSFGMPTKKEDGKEYCRVTLKKPKQ